MSQTPPSSATRPILASKPAVPIANRNKWLYWSLFGLAIFIMLGCALVSFAGNLLESGVTAFIGAFAAVFLVPIYVGLFLWLDRFEPEPPQYLVAAFVWGAGVAGLFACIFNTIFGTVAAQVIDPDAANQLMASISAPLIEETLKGLAVAILFFWLKDQFDDVLDGIIYAGMAALGFAMIENVSYYSRAMNAGTGAFVANFIVRGIMSPYTHVLFTSMTGIGFGIARQTKSVPLKFIAPIAGWILAMVLHCTWNTLPWVLVQIAGDEGVGTLLFLLFYVILWIPLFLVLLGIIGYSLRRESRLIKRHLLENAAVTHIEPVDADQAARLLPRLTGNVIVLFTKGTAGWQRTRRFQHATTALAFYRERVERGRVLANPELEALYIEQITVNRPAPKA